METLLYICDVHMRHLSKIESQIKFGSVGFWYVVLSMMSLFIFKRIHHTKHKPKWHSNCFFIHAFNGTIAFARETLADHIFCTNRLLKRKNYCLRCESRREIKWIECTLYTWLQFSQITYIHISHWHSILSLNAFCEPKIVINVEKKWEKVNKLWHFVVWTK